MPQLTPTLEEVQVRSAVQHIATFTASARPEHLKSNIRQLYKRNILDSLGCAIAGLQGRPFQALREQFEEYRAPGRCTLIGGGKTSADQAALFNSSLVRYVDLLDSYMAVGGLCHPSDNFGTILAAAEQVGASGEQFMLALAVAYEIQCRFTSVARHSGAIPTGVAKGDVAGSPRTSTDSSGLRAHPNDRLRRSAFR
jgi:2-methylcitrate dehydratase